MIHELRRKRRSYQEISVFFKEHLKIPVAPSTLYEFVKSRRARPAKKPVVELPDVEASRPAEFQAGKTAGDGSGSGFAAGPARCGPKPCAASASNRRRFPKSRRVSSLMPPRRRTGPRIRRRNDTPSINPVEITHA